jgi:AcrR family transcriptional regulator
MVDAIVAATARVLVKDGYEALSTNRVAERAGVSVGSLYQYFPSKEALVVAVMERHIERMTGELGDRLAAMADRPIDEVARALVHLLLDAHRVDPKLHRALMSQVPRVGAFAGMNELTARLEARIVGFLSSRRRDVGVSDPALAAFVLVRAAEALTHAAVIERPDLLAGAELEAEIVRLIVAYLR